MQSIPSSKYLPPNVKPCFRYDILLFLLLLLLIIVIIIHFWGRPVMHGLFDMIAGCDCELLVMIQQY